MKEVYENIGRALDVPAKLIRAISVVESLGEFEIGEGKITILLERHWVYKLAIRKFGMRKTNQLARRYPNICNPNSGGYGKYRDQYKRLAKAIRHIDKEIAHQATSFGAYQIMGFNFKAAGYHSATEMAKAYHDDPKVAQVESFMMFITNYKHGRALTALREGDIHEFAKLYNGPNYSKNRYAKRIAEEVARYD